MNAAPANEKLVGLPLEALSWLLVNEVEGAFLAGTGGAGGDSGHAGGAVPGDHCGADLGRTGALLQREGAGGPGPSPENGGGGHHCGGRHLHRLLPAPALEGGTLEEALSLAAAASALAVSRPGAADAVPGYEEVLRTL